MSNYLLPNVNSDIANTEIAFAIRDVGTIKDLTLDVNDNTVSFSHNGITFDVSGSSSVFMYSNNNINGSLFSNADGSELTSNIDIIQFKKFDKPIFSPDLVNDKNGNKILGGIGADIVNTIYSLNDADIQNVNYSETDSSLIGGWDVNKRSSILTELQELTDNYFSSTDFSGNHRSYWDGVVSSIDGVAGTVSHDFTNNDMIWMLYELPYKFLNYTSGLSAFQSSTVLEDTSKILLGWRVVREPTSVQLFSPSPANDNYYGLNVAINNTDDVMAVSEPFSDHTQSDDTVISGGGNVYVYRKVAGNWTLSETIQDDALTAGSDIGRRFSISGNGNRLSIQRFNSHTSNTQCLIYDYADSSWTLTKTYTFDTIGPSNVGELSENGKLIALSSLNSNVKIYDIETDTQIGNTISDESSGTNHSWGDTIRINKDGTSLAIGHSGYDLDGKPSSDNTGRIMTFILTQNVWTSRGNIIGDDLGSEDYSLGTRFDMNGDGSAIAAVGILRTASLSNNSLQFMKIFKYIGSGWKLVYYDINSTDHTFSSVAHQVAISSNGRSVAVSNYKTDGSKTARIYYDDDGWTVKNELDISSFITNTGNFTSSSSLTMSPSASVIVFGYPRSDANNQGSVIVYNLQGMDVNYVDTSNTETVKMELWSNSRSNAGNRIHLSEIEVYDENNNRLDISHNYELRKRPYKFEITLDVDTTFNGVTAGLHNVVLRDLQFENEFDEVLSFKEQYFIYRDESGNDLTLPTQSFDQPASNMKGNNVDSQCIMTIDRTNSDLKLIGFGAVIIPNTQNHSRLKLKQMNYNLNWGGSSDITSASFEIDFLDSAGGYMPNPANNNVFTIQSPSLIDTLEKNNPTNESYISPIHDSDGTLNPSIGPYISINPGVLFDDIFHTRYIGADHVYAQFNVPLTDGSLDLSKLSFKLIPDYVVVEDYTDGDTIGPYNLQFQIKDLKDNLLYDSGDVDVRDATQFAALNDYNFYDRNDYGHIRNNSPTVIPPVANQFTLAFTQTSSRANYGVTNSTNADGTIVAVSSYSAAEEYIYRLNSLGSWSETELLTRFGGSSGDGSHFGRFSSFSAVGDRIAISYASSSFNNGCQIFEFINNSWVHIRTIEGFTISHDVPVKLSSDGTKVAIADGSHESVRVFNVDDGTQIGSNITIASSDVEFGYEIDMNADGTIILAGAHRYADGGSNNVGAAFIFEYNGTSWSQKGNTIIGSIANSRLGMRNSMSDDGLTFITSLRRLSGVSNPTNIAFIYKYSDSLSDWELKHSIANPAESTLAGPIMVSMNGSGTLATLQNYIQISTKSVTLVLYENSVGTWSEFAQIDNADLTTGNTSGAMWPLYNSLSGMGNRLVISYANNAVGDQFARIYDLVGQGVETGTEPVYKVRITPGTNNGNGYLILSEVSIQSGDGTTIALSEPTAFNTRNETTENATMLLDGDINTKYHSDGNSVANNYWQAEFTPFDNFIVSVTGENNTNPACRSVNVEILDEDNNVIFSEDDLEIAAIDTGPITDTMEVGFIRDSTPLSFTANTSNSAASENLHQLDTIDSTDFFYSLTSTPDMDDFVFDQRFGRTASLEPQYEMSGNASKISTQFINTSSNGAYFTFVLVSTSLTNIPKTPFTRGFLTEEIVGVHVTDNAIFCKTNSNGDGTVNSQWDSFINSNNKGTFTSKDVITLEVTNSTTAEVRLNGVVIETFALQHSGPWIPLIHTPSQHGVLMFEVA